MRLKYVLILATLVCAAGTALLAFDLNQRVLSVAGVTTAPEQAFDVLLSIGSRYQIVLVATATMNLAILLLLLATLREERTQLLIQIEKQTLQHADANEVAKAGIYERLTAPIEYPWGQIEGWQSAQAHNFYELCRTATPDTSGIVRFEWDTFEKFLAAPEFDAQSSSMALDDEGALLGALLAIRQPLFEDDGYWWLESPAVIALLLVHPEHRNKGIGRALMERTECAALHRLRPRLFVGGLENLPHLVPGVAETDRASRLFFNALGYREARRTCLMQASYADFVPPAELVERETRVRAQGYSFSPAQAEDAAAFKQLLQMSLLDRIERRLERFVAAPERYYLAWKDIQLVGFLEIEPIDAKKRSGIRLIHFLRAHRGSGLGSILLIKAHELWMRMGAEGGSIWTYPEAAERFYPRAGFRKVQDWIVYEKDLSHSWQDKTFVDRWR